MRPLTAAQRDAVNTRDSKPIYLIELNIVGAEYLSTNADQLVDSTVFKSADIGITSVDNWQSASIKLRPTIPRIQQLTAQLWRYGTCKLYLLPTITYMEYIDDDYVMEDYGTWGYFQAAPILLVDGSLTGASYASDRCEFTVSHKVIVGRWLPALRIDPPLCNHLPRPGEVLTWENEKFTLEAR